MTKVEWGYSERAAHYDKRAEYAAGALDSVLAKMHIRPPLTVADIGAGTGKLSRPLAQRGLSVLAVEPNDDMRRFGVRNTQGLDVKWSAGTGEQTGLPASSVPAVFFGSSFNVVDQLATLRECARILIPGGWFCCMWNHRDLDDPVQLRIENVIKAAIPGYDYGLRRVDPTEVIKASGSFEAIGHVEETFEATMATEDIIEAWKSHATLARQAGERMPTVIQQIRAVLPQSDAIVVPYTTRIWFARRRG